MTGISWFLYCSFSVTFVRSVFHAHVIEEKILR